jgi:nicotinate-nucleotide pyrophosphorylase
MNLCDLKSTIYFIALIYEFSGNKPEEAILYCKTPGVLCGTPFVEQILKKVGCSIHWNIAEGTFIDPDKFPTKRADVAIVKGEARKILSAERLALNVLARASGIATLAREVSEIAKKHNFEVRLLCRLHMHVLYSLRILFPNMDDFALMFM